MKKKMKRFEEGGLSTAQEEWLGGADRTDPYILARMRAAVPDSVASNVAAPSRDFDIEDVVAPKAIEKTVVKTKVSPTKKSEVVEETKSEKKPSENNEYLNRSRSVVDGVKNVGKQFTTLRNYDPLQKIGDVLSGVRKWGQTPLDEQAKKFKSASNMKKGGSVKSSASSRADGCCIRGKTRA